MCVQVSGYFAVGFIVFLTVRYALPLAWRDDPRILFFLCLGLWPVVVVVLVVRGLLRFSRWFIQKTDDAVAFLFRRKIHSDEYGELYRVPKPGGMWEAVVRVRDSNGTYWIPVPPDMQRAKQAVAWTYHMDESEFNPKRV